jgi:hypothetical protein
MMKFSLRLNPDRPMTHAEAVGCMTANLALPGAGSLAAGRSVGYAQLAVCTVGAAAVRWYLQINQQFADAYPETFLVDLWKHLQWPLVGMGIFLVATGWAALTGRQILAAHPKEPPRPPPII